MDAGIVESDPGPPPETPPRESPGEPAIAPRSSKDLWIETAVVLIALVVPSTLYSFRSFYLFGRISPQFSIGGMLFGSLDYLGPLALLFFLIGKSGEPWSKFGLCRPQWGDILRTIGVLMALLAGQSPARSFVPHLEFPGSLVAAVYCILAGLHEEILMRGYLIPRFERLLGSPWWSLLLTSVLFGCVHAYQGPFRIFQTMIFGVICGAFFLWLRRIWPLAMAHAIINFLVLSNPSRWSES